MLTGEDVTNRTDTVIKLANVTGSSAEEVSSYMTAIWNNFDDGSQSLEHYADVITALGAATASSSAEISQGLEKFAAIGSTVGLSYEYATTALATVVAQTRQSADTVGTAFKTLFARIQDLELGDTLEDGTTLGKYSQALETIGVNIKDAKGEVKDMDTILNEMGSKWKTISKDTQIAVAQTVAGTRQYAQLVALLDNWDQFQSNLDVANSSEGALQNQADIYAESWEAASKRLKASLQGLWGDILNDDFFIELTDGAAKFVEKIDEIVKALGGVKNILPTILAILSQIFSKNFGQFIDNQIVNFQNSSKKMIAFQQEAMDALNYITQGGDDKGLGKLSESELTNLEVTYKQGLAMQEVINKKQELIKQGYELNEVDNLVLNTLIAQSTEAGENVKKNAKAAEEEIQNYNKLTEAFKKLADEKKVVFQTESTKTEKLTANASELAEAERLQRNTKARLKTAQNNLDASNNDKSKQQQYAEKVKTETQILEEQTKSVEELRQKREELNNMPVMTDKNNQDLQTEISNLADLSLQYSVFYKTIEDASNIELKFGNAASDEQLVNMQKGFNDLIVSFEKTGAETKDLDKTWNEYINDLKSGGKNAQKLFSNFTDELAKAGAASANGLRESIENYNIVDEKAKKELLDIIDQIEKGGEVTAEQINKLVQATVRYGGSLDALKNKTDNIKIPSLTLGQNISNTINGITGLTSALTSLQGVANSFKEGNYLGGLTGLTGVVYGGNRAAQSVTKGITSYFSAKGEKKRAELKDLTEGTAEYTKVLGEAKKAEDTATTASKGLVKSITSLVGGWGAAALGGAAFVVAIAAVISKVKAYNDAIAAQKAQEESSKQVEKLKQLKEESEQLTELKNKYKELLESQKDASPEELKNQTYDLCMQYGQESLAIQALTGDYNNLTDVIERNAQAKANALNSQVDVAKKSLSADVNATLDNTMEGWTHTGYNDDSQSLDLWAFGASEAEDNFRKEIKDAFGVNISNSGLVKGDDILSMMFQDPDKLKEIANKYQDAVPDMLEAIQQLEKAGITEKINAIQESRKQALENEYTAQNLTAENYSKTLKEMVDKATKEGIFTGANTEAQARTWAKTCLSAIGEEIHNFDERETLTNVLFGKEAIDADYQKIAKLTDQEFEDISRNSNIFNTILKINDGNFDKAKKDFYEHYKELIDTDRIYSDLEDRKTTITNSESSAKERFNVLMGYDPKAWKEEAEKAKQDLEDYNKDLKSNLIDQLNNFGQSTGQTTEGFFSKSLDEKVEIYKQYVDNINEKIKTITEISDSTLINNDTKNIDIGKGQFAINYSKDIFIQKILNKDDELFNHDLAQQSKEAVAATLAQIAQIDLSDENNISELFTTDEKNLNDSKLALKQYLQEFFNLSEESFKATEFTINDLFNQITSNAEKIKSLKFDDLSISDVFNTQQELLESFNKTISDTKSAYNSLNTITEDYNENGYLSVENLQTLTSLGPQYLATLKKENGQLVLDKEAYLDVVKAQYLNEAATLALALQKNILAAAEDEEKKKELMTTLALMEETDATYDLLDARLLLAEQAARDSGDYELLEYYKKMEGVIRSIADSANNLTLDNLNSSSKSSSKETIRYLDKEFDRFHDIKIAIQELADAMSDLEKQKKHLVGGELITALQTENNLLAAQKSNYDALLKGQQTYVAQLRAELSSNYGVKFDPTTGNISNYNQITKTATDTFDDDKFSRFKELLSDYDTLLTNIEDTVNNIDDVLYKQIENNLEAFEIKIELDLDLEDAKREINNFFKEINEGFRNIYKTSDEWDDIFNTASANSESYRQSIQIKQDKIDAVKKAISENDFGNEGSMFASRSEALAYLKTAEKDLMEDVKSLYKEYSDAWDAYIEEIDEYTDKWNDILDGFDEINKTLDHYEKLITLMYDEGTEASQEALLKIAQEQADVSKAKMAAAQQEVLKYQSLYDEALAAAGGDETQEDVVKLKEALSDAYDDLYKSAEDYLAIAQKVLDKQGKIAADNAMKAQFGKTYDEFKQDWEYDDTKNKGYYDDVERIYQLNSLSNKYEQAMIGVSTKNQKRLKELEESRLKILKERGELSEDQVKYETALLEVEKSRIALEEAQKNKNSMKLTRGADGNWSYQYVADQGGINDAKQKLSDAENNAYEVAKTGATNNSKEIVTLTQEYYDKKRELDKKYAGDQTKLNEEQVALYDTYYGDDGAITKRTADSEYYRQSLAAQTVEVLKEQYELDKTNFENASAEVKAIVEGTRDLELKCAKDYADYISGDEYKESVQGSVEAINSEICSSFQATWSADEDSALAAVANFKEETDTYLADYNKAVEDAKDKTKVSTEGIDTSLKTVSTDLEKVNEEVNDLLDDDTKAKLKEHRTVINSLGTAWETVKTNMSSYVKNIPNTIEELKKLGEAAEAAAKKVESASYDTSGHNFGGDEVPTEEPWSVQVTNKKTGKQEEKTFKNKSSASSYANQIKNSCGSGVTATITENAAGRIFFVTISETVNNKSKTNGNYFISVVSEDEGGIHNVVSGNNYSKENASDYMSQLFSNNDQIGTYNENNFTTTDKDGKTTTTKTNTYQIKIEKSKIHTGMNGWYYQDQFLTSDMVKYPDIDSIYKAILNRYKYGTSFATGGYTGSWSGSDGRLAFLHQKELILNAEDTENILSAVNAIRDMTSLQNNLKMDMMMMQRAALEFEYDRNVRNMTTSNSTSSGDNIFNINAEFPNATNSDEIRKAILDLPNLASQYLTKLKNM